MKLSIAVLVLVLTGCQRQVIPVSHDEVVVPANLPKVNNVDCHNMDNQVNVHLADRTLVTGCNVIVDGVDQFMSKPEGVILNEDSVWVVATNPPPCIRGEVNWTYIGKPICLLLSTPVYVRQSK